MYLASAFCKQMKNTAILVAVLFIAPLLLSVHGNLWGFASVTLLHGATLLAVQGCMAPLCKQFSVAWRHFAGSARLHHSALSASIERGCICVIFC
jgi:hypothetical protein